VNVRSARAPHNRRTLTHNRAVCPVAVLLAICCCLSAVSGRWLETENALPDERPVSADVTVAPTLSSRVGAPFEVYIGRVDTIGGTTYDWQASGPAWRMLVDSRRYGIHATWMHSSDTSDTTFPDLNMRYTFHDAGFGWNWIDPVDILLSGVHAFVERAGFGNIDVDRSGAAVISAHHATSAGLAPIVARDADVGAGIFEYSDGEPTIDGYASPCIGVSTNGYYQLAMTDYSTQGSLYWSRSTAWRTWDPAMRIPPPAPEALFPGYNIATSKASNSGKVCVTWVVTPASGYAQEPGFYRESPDGGHTWHDPVQLEFPPAFTPLSETVPSFHVTSLFPLYDNDERLNIVANVSPYVNDTNWVDPSEIWHYSPDNKPVWNRIHIAGCDPDNLLGSVGINVTYACRPSIAQDDYGDLFVTWEQFDSTNVEPTTSRLRAGIWAAGSTDGGVSWSTALKLTTPGTASCRFPSICDLTWPGDSLAVLYELDQCAGFAFHNEGPLTVNPIVVQKVPIRSIVERGPYYGRLKEPNGGETLFAGDTFAIKWIVIPKTFDHGVVSLSTDGGSTFPTVIGESIPPTDTIVLWNSIPQVCCSLCRVKFEAKDSLGATVFSDASYRDFTIDTVSGGVSGNRLEPSTEFTSEPTVIRGVLYLPLASGVEREASSVLLDISGRKVLDLGPGANDVRALAPGVYFVREAQAQAQAIRKVVVTK